MMSTNNEDNLCSLRIGVFGRTFAGKTEFLYRLLTANPDLLLNKSAAAVEFVRDFRQRRESNEPTATTADIESISATLLLPGNDRPLNITFGDLRGEVLERDLLALDENAIDDNLVVKQIHSQRCNAFLFFFDPTCQDRPQLVDKHYEESLRHLERLLSYVVPKKQNDYLPIVFVLTKRDLWQTAEVDALDSRVQDWSDQAIHLLNNHYRRTLSRTFPDHLVDRSLVLVEVNSTQDNGEDVLQTIRNVADLEQDVLQFRQKLRKHSRRVVLALSLVLLVVVGAFAFVLLSRGPDKTVPGPNTEDPIGVAGLNPKQVAEKLKSARERLDAYSELSIAVSEDDAVAIGEDLHWISVKQKQNRNMPDDSPSLIDNTPLEQMRDALAAFVLQRSESAASKPQAGSLARLESMLNRIPQVDARSGPLLNATINYWRAYRQEIVGDLAGVLRKHLLAKDSSQRTLQDVEDSLTKTVRESRNSQVPRGDSGEKLIQELEFADTLCQKLLKDRVYFFDVTIVKAILESDVGTDRARRKLTLNVGVKQTEVFGVQLTVKGNHTPFALEATEKPTKVRMPLDREGTLRLSILSSKSGKWIELYEVPDWCRSARDKMVAPIVMPGIPLLRMDSESSSGKTAFDPTLLHQLRVGTGYKFDLKIDNLPQVPRLLVESVVRSYSKVETP